MAAQLSRSATVPTRSRPTSSSHSAPGSLFLAAVESVLTRRSSSPESNRVPRPLLLPPRLLSAELREKWKFFFAFLRSPGRVGAICPSSRFLARAMVAGCRLDTAALVVELGPGTGVFTREILQAVGPQTRVLALEIDADSVERLRRSFPRVEVIHDSAEAVWQHVARTGLPHADCVLSGLPWVAMPAELQHRIMQNVVAALRPGGTFRTFAYLITRQTPSARRYRRLLHTLFREVRVGAPIWRNVPPALVYSCVK